MAQISEFVKKSRIEQHLTQQELADSEASVKSDIRSYRLSSLEEPMEYMLEEIMRQVCEVASLSSAHAAEVLRKKYDEI